MPLYTPPVHPIHPYRHPCPPCTPYIHSYPPLHRPAQCSPIETPYTPPQHTLGTFMYPYIRPCTTLCTLGVFIGPYIHPNRSLCSFTYPYILLCPPHLFLYTLSASLHPPPGGMYTPSGEGEYIYCPMHPIVPGIPYTACGRALYTLYTACMVGGVGPDHTNPYRGHIAWVGLL